MESSGESFTWTDASNDSSIMIAEANDGDHESQNDSKKETKKAPIESPPQEKEIKKKKRRASEMLESSINKDEIVKVELESDLEAPKKKKKRKNIESDYYLEPSQDSLLAEDYLNLRVKQEQLSFVEPEPVKKKKKKDKKDKQKVENEFETQDSESTESSIRNDEVNNDNDKSLNNFGDSIIEIDKFEAEETVVQKRKKRKDDSKSNISQNGSISSEKSPEKVLSQNSIEMESHSLTNGYVESESDFEPKIKLKPAPQIKASKSKKKSLETETVNKSTRISDRIVFDEDSADSEKEVVISKQLQQFLNVNPNLKPHEPEVQKENIITDEDEVWVLRVPKEVDVKAFKDIDITLASKLKVKINGNSYDGSLENHLSRVPLLCYGRNKSYIKNIPCMGEINLRKRIPKAHIPQESCMVNNQSNFIPLPETKCRHPLFGSNYKKAIKIPSAIAERLNSHIENDSSELFNGKKEKKRKQKKEKKERIAKESEPEMDTAEIDTSEVQELSSKKKRKRKNSEDMTKTKKPKRTKLEPDSAEAWESERAIEENLFNF